MPRAQSLVVILGSCCLAMSTAAPSRAWTWAEIAESEDCLVVVYGEVYNFSDHSTRSEQKGGRTFFERHPGGAAVTLLRVVNAGRQRAQPTHGQYAQGWERSAAPR